MVILKKKRRPRLSANLRIVHLPYQPSPYLWELTENLRTDHRDVNFGRTINFQLVNLSVLYAVLKQRPLNTIHLHWQHPFFVSKTSLGTILKSFLSLAQILLARAIGIRIIWTVHNLKSHENRHNDLELFFSRLLSILADALIAHCHSAADEIQKAFKADARKIYVIPHGNLVNRYENSISLQEARIKLGLRSTDFTFLFFGIIRPYKGVPELMYSFKRLRAPDTRLVIAGQPRDKRLKQTIEKEALSDDRMLLSLKYIHADEVQIYMNAADVVVLPYLDILSSGAALLGMSFGKALIAPRLGCIPELVNSAGGFTYDPGEGDGLFRAMEKALRKRSQLNRIGRHNMKRAEKLDWSKIAKMTSNIYQQCTHVNSSK